MKKQIGGSTATKRKPNQLTNRCRSDVSPKAFNLFSGVLGKTWTFEESLTETIDPSLFSSSREFLPEYWAVESFSKIPINIGIDREAVAIQGFRDAEDLCRSVTSQLVPQVGAKTLPLVGKVRARLRWLLDGISVDEVISRSRWSQGACTSLNRAFANPQNKWAFATHATSDAAMWLEVWNRRYRDSRFSAVTLRDTNIVTTVPKNAKTDRTIALEPDWNMFFQLGMGACIRRRLQRVGLLRSPRAGEVASIDNDAKQRQMWFAKEGSINQNYATIDLKAASDTISLAVCDLLLPRRIFNMLSQLRSPKGELADGTIVEYEKISSMGNGYTFELETALFWAISSVAAETDDVHVFGDDIIVPQSKSHQVIDALMHFGFTPNMKKTHTSGPFRESCGGHYFNGVDVTPPYFRKKLDTVTAVIAGYNSLVSRLSGSVSSALSHDLMDTLGRRLREEVHPVFWGPPGRDGVLAVPYDAYQQHRGLRNSFMKKHIRERAKCLGRVPGLGLTVLDVREVADQCGGLHQALYKIECEASWIKTHGDSYKVQAWTAWPWSYCIPF